MVPLSKVTSVKTLRNGSDARAIGTLSLSNASLTGFEGRAAGDAGVEGGVSAIVWRACYAGISNVWSPGPMCVLRCRIALKGSCCGVCVARKVGARWRSKAGSDHLGAEVLGEHFMQTAPAARDWEDAWRP